MSEPTVTNQQIADAAASPQQVTVDGVTVTQRSVAEVTEAQANLANSQNATSPRRGLLFTKLIPGSARGS
jgi:hypothetical protein